jgi:hypothetical protein
MAARSGFEETNHKWVCSFKLGALDLIRKFVVAQIMVSTMLIVSKSIKAIWKASMRDSWKASKGRGRC